MDYNHVFSIAKVSHAKCNSFLHKRNIMEGISTIPMNVLHKHSEDQLYSIAHSPCVLSKVLGHSRRHPSSNNHTVKAVKELEDTKRPLKTA